MYTYDNHESAEFLALCLPVSLVAIALYLSVFSTTAIASESKVVEGSRE